MRAGKLDKTITIQHFTSTVDDFGTPIETWANVATVRAQLIQSTTEEFMRSFGQSSETAAIFRIRYLDSIATTDRVSFSGQLYDIKEVKELGRREGLDLRCMAREAY